MAQSCSHVFDATCRRQNHVYGLMLKVCCLEGEPHPVDAPLLRLAIRRQQPAANLLPLFPAAPRHQTPRRHRRSKKTAMGWGLEFCAASPPDRTKRGLLFSHENVHPILNSLAWLDKHAPCRPQIAGSPLPPSLPPPLPPSLPPPRHVHGRHHDQALGSLSASCARLSLFLPLPSAWTSVLSARPAVRRSATSAAAS